MIKKIISIVLVLIGLFFLIGVIALLQTVWGAVFCGVIMLGCFYLAYRLYPRKEKNDVVVPQPVKETKLESKKTIDTEPVKEAKPEPIKTVESEPVKEIKAEPEAVTEIKVAPKKTEQELYSLNSKEFREVTDKAGEYFEKIKNYSLNCNSLTEDDINNIDKLFIEICETREKLPRGSNRRSIKLLTDIFLDMNEICNSLEYYIDDKDVDWINNITLKFSTIGENFSYLADVIKGEMNDL